MVVEILIFLWKKCVQFSAPLSHSVRRGDMDAWVPQEIHMHNTIQSDDPLTIERSCLTAKVKLTEDSVHTALYQRVSIAALAGKAVTHKISCG